MELSGTFMGSLACCLSIFSTFLFERNMVHLVEIYLWSLVVLSLMARFFFSPFF